MDNKWHIRFYQVANLVASWSKDPEAKVGAVVVSPDKSQFISGYNDADNRIWINQYIGNTNSGQESNSSGH